MGCLVYLLVNTVVLMTVAGFFGEYFHLSGIGAAIVASLILSIINTFIRPLLVILTLPITFITLGIFLFIINAGLLMLTAAIMGEAFVISSFWMALLAAIIIAILNALINSFV